MDAVMRAVVIYLWLLVVFRMTGNRSLAQITVFDFVLLLIISEAAQNGLVGNDYSVTNSLLLIVTLFTLDIGLSLIKGKLPKLERFVEGVPVLLVRDGEPLRDHMKKSQVDEQDILEAARKLRGLERMEQVKYAVLERDGEITVVPKRRAE